MTHAAVLFDLDGTLLDTLADLAHAMNRVLEARGFPGHAVDAYRFLVGEGVVNLVTQALPEDCREATTVEECLLAFREDYGRNCDVATRAYDGVPELLDELTGRGVRLAILSNKPHAYTQLCVTRLLSRWNFEVVFGMRQGVPPKPDPAAAFEVSVLMSLPPRSFLYLGDTAIDMRTAAAAGMFPLGVLWGFRPAEELLTGGALALIERPIQALDFLGK